MSMMFASILSKASTFINMLRKAEFRELYSKLMRHNRFAYYQLDDNKGYRRWYKTQHLQLERNASNITLELETLKYKPLISILLILDEREEFWTATIQSVIKQLYNNWELCIAVRDGGLDESYKTQIATHPKVKIKYINKFNNKGVVLNDLLKTAKGEYILIAKAGDELAVNFLSSCVKALNIDKNYKIIYGDEDRIDKNQQHLDPFFKPDFSPELLHSIDYISRASILQVALVNKVAGFNKDLDSCHSYELVLKMLNILQDKEIHHIPKILYHSRVIYGEGGGHNISNAVTSSQIVERILQKENFDTKVAPFKIDFERIFHKISISSKNSKTWPKVSIIIPTKNKVDLLRTCINSIKLKTSYPNYEVIVVDNQSTDHEALDYLKLLKDDKNSIKVIEYNHEYNYSAINNYAVTIATGSIICFLNNDTEVINCNWLEEMVVYLLRPGVGAVGAKLYYPNSQGIQHAGLHVAHNPYLPETGNHIVLSYGHQPNDSSGYLNNLYLVQNMCAVVGACFLVHKQAFIDIGGFDEENTPTSYCEVDLCFQLRECGYRIVWTPYAELYHYEGASRGLEAYKSKAAHKYMIKQWAKYFQNDIYVNKNLSFYYKNYPVLLKDNTKSQNTL